MRPTLHYRSPPVRWSAHARRRAGAIQHVAVVLGCVLAPIWALLAVPLFGAGFVALGIVVGSVAALFLAAGVFRRSWLRWGVAATLLSCHGVAALGVCWGRYDLGDVPFTCLVLQALSVGQTVIAAIYGTRDRV